MCDAGIDKRIHPVVSARIEQGRICSVKEERVNCYAIQGWSHNSPGEAGISAFVKASAVNRGVKSSRCDRIKSKRQNGITSYCRCKFVQPGTCYSPCRPPIATFEESVRSPRINYVGRQRIYRQNINSSSGGWNQTGIRRGPACASIDCFVKTPTHCSCVDICRGYRIYC